MPDASLLSPFQQRVYQLLQTLPAGKVTTYGDLARALHTSPRAVGQALKQNPYAPRVPCHRVVMSDGSIGGYQGAQSGRQIKKKIALLEREGVEVQNKRINNFERVRYQWQ